MIAQKNQHQASYHIYHLASSYTLLDFHQDRHQFPQVVEEYTVCLTHWGRVTHICVDKLSIIGSDNGLSPGRHQAIIWSNAGI